MNKYLFILFIIIGCSQAPVGPVYTPNMIIPRQIFNNSDSLFFRTFVPEELYDENIVPKNLRNTARIIATYEIPQVNATQVVITFNGIADNTYSNILYIDSLPSILTITSTRSPFVTRISRITYYNENSIVATRLNIKAAFLKKYHPMPNVANIVREVFTLQAHTKIRVGLPFVGGMWVEITNATAFLNSMYSRRYSMPHRYVIYTGFNYNHRNEPLRGKRSVVSPEFYENKLFAEILMFKFNIRCSELSITPQTINTPENYQLSQRADSMMTLWPNYTTEQFNLLYHQVYVKNNEYQAPMDTLSITPLKIKGYYFGPTPNTN